MLKQDYDVIVIGGGPAGSCVAGKLAQQGLSVLVIEGKSFPRNHIGESLLAMSMPLLQDLGVDAKLAKMDFIRKTGSLFVWGASDKELELGMPYPGFAYQVLRARFDQLLLEHTQEQGAYILYRQWVRDVIWNESGRVCGVRVEDQSGHSYDLFCHFVVDASGLAQFLPRQLKLPLYLEGPRRVALGAYFENALRPDAPRENDIISEACQDGWIWFIPLSKQLTSVGFVTDENLFNSYSKEVLAHQIATAKLIKKLLVPATLAKDVQALHYTNHMVDTSLWGEGYILVGDSAMFVDPLFSTGVHGALYSATLAAGALTSVLSGIVTEKEAGTWYQQRVMAHYLRVNETVKVLYGIHPGKSLFWQRRNISQISETQAEQIAQHLGSTGIAFFANTAHANVLNLPSVLAQRVPEFVGKVKPVPIHPDCLLELNAEVTLSKDWMLSQGQLVPAISLSHVRNRTPHVEFPIGSFYANLVQLLAGCCTLAAAVQKVNEIGHTQSVTLKQASIFIGTLVQAGLFTCSEPVGISMFDIHHKMAV